MINLLTIVHDKLKTFHPNVYFEQAETGATFPYIVYRLPTSIEDYQKEDFILEVDIWGNNPDTTQIENLTQSIDGNGDIESPTGLHRYHFYDANTQASFYRINRLMLHDPDKNIRRRQLRYVVKAYL